MQINSIDPIRNESLPGFEQRPLPLTKAPEDHSPLPADLPEAQTGNIVGRKETDKALHELGEAVRQFNVSLKFTRDEETGTIVVRMIDQTSGETLQQIPNEASLHIAATLSKLQGSIFNCKA